MRTPFHRRQLEDEQNGRRGARPGRGPEERPRRRERKCGHRRLPALHRRWTAFQGHPRHAHPARRAEHALRGERRLHRRNRRRRCSTDCAATTSSSATPSAASIFGETDAADHQEGRWRPSPPASSRSSASAKPWPNTKPARPKVVDPGRAECSPSVDTEQMSRSSSSPTSRSGPSAPAAPPRPRGPGSARFHPRILRSSRRRLADAVRIQYGGSVKPANAKEL